MTEAVHLALQDLATGENRSPTVGRHSTLCETEDFTPTPKHDASSAVAFLQSISLAVRTSGRLSRKRSYREIFPCSHKQNVENRKLIGNNCIVVLTYSILSSKSEIEACLKLLSQDVKACVRNLLHYNLGQPLPETITQTIDAVAGVSQTILSTINCLIFMKDTDHKKFHSLAKLEKTVLTSLRDLARHVRKICPDTHIKTVKIIQLAATDIGIIGKQLMQQELHNLAIEVLSPLWPFPKIKELLPYITHYECLCESYLTSGRIEQAWNVAKEVIMIDICLVSGPVVRVLNHLLEDYEPLFSQANCLDLLNKAMTALLSQPMFDDTLALGTLLYWEIQITTVCNGKLNSEKLMKKATTCLEIWIHWFHSVGSELLGIEGIARANLSFKFLRKVAELAIVNFKNFTAVKSLCEAYCLAQRMKQWDVVRDVTRIIVTLTPDLGLQLAPATQCDDPENMDLFMDSVGLGKDAGLLSLVAIATHHFKTGQLKKFWLVCDAIDNQLSSQHCDDNVTIFSRAVIKRLKAEYLMLPDSKMMEERYGGASLKQHAIVLAASSYELINRLYLQFESKFPWDEAQCNALGPWQIIHEFLCTVKLLGELFLYVGCIPKVKRYFMEGMCVAAKFKLAIWGSIFASRLVEQALLYSDLSEATFELQNAQSYLKHSISTSEPCLQGGHGTPSVEIVSSDKLACGFKMTRWQDEPHSCSIQQKISLRHHLLSDLLKDSEPESGDITPDRDCLILTDISACCGCCQLQNVATSINLMCFQAEILWRKKKSICFVSSLLQHSLNMAYQLVSLSACNNLVELFTDSGLKVSCLNRNIHISNRVLAETAYRCAEIYSQNLYIKSAYAQLSCDHAEPDVGYVLNLLDIAEVVGCQARGFHMCNVIVASAFLLRSSVDYLTVLKTLPIDDVPEPEAICGSFPSELDVIPSVVREAARKRMSWDDRRSLLLFPVLEENSKETVSKSEQQSCRNLAGSCAQGVPEVETVAYSDSIDDGQGVNQHSDENEKSLRFNKLTEKFPSLAACQNVAQRISCLRGALQQFHDYTHYWLYRQTSQSMALCLWEEQMVDAWQANQACSKQVDIAAHLTDSMNVTFQHLMYIDFCNKLRMTDVWENLSQEEVQKDQQAIRDAMSTMSFGGDVVENFKGRLALLPADWTVVQVTIANFDPTNPGNGQIFVTRLNRNQEPITIGLPRHTFQLLTYIKRVYKATILSCTCLSCYTKGHKHIPEILNYLQEVFLAGYRWLLRGLPGWVKQQPVQAYLDDAGRRAVDTVQQQHGYRVCYTELRSLLDILLEANEGDIRHLVESMWPPHVTATLTQIFMQVQKGVIKMCEGHEDSKRGPVILILDNELIHFPWESMPDLISDTVTRVPSLANLTALLTWHTNRAESLFMTGVDRSRVTAHVPLISDGLEDVYKLLVQELKQYQDWNICTDTVQRSVQVLEPIFKNSSLYLYYGHSWEDYNLPQNLLGRAFVMIMGCDTGFLSTDWKIDAFGGALNFLMAGCPAVLGNLWVACAIEFSKINARLCSSWMSQRKPISIRELLVLARQVCETPGLSGSGLVIHGLPMMMN